MGKRLTNMTLKDFLKYASIQLKDAAIDAPVLEAGVMLCHALKIDRIYLYAHDDRVLTDDEKNVLMWMLEQRVKHTPLQYLTGETEFMSLPFKVSPAVLIPRQDTELLVEKCIEIVKEKGRRMDRSVALLDMCTGSGCIAVSIAHYCPNCRVTAVDISSEALAVAEDNKKLNSIGEQLEFICGDLFQPLGPDKKYDIISSNPPYIESETIPGLQQEVRGHEPMLALDGGRDGLEFYKRIINAAPAYLYPNGILLFEIGYNQGQSVKGLMEVDFCDIKIYKDLGGNDRVVAGRLSVIPEP